MHFFAGTAPLRLEIAEFHPNIDQRTKPTTTFSFLSLLFSLLNLKIFITNSPPRGFVFIWLRPRPCLFFFSVFEKKNTGVHVAYSNRFRPSPLSQSRHRFRFPLIKTLKRWKYDSMIASLTRHTLYDEWDHRIYDLRFRPSTQNYKPACSKKITILTYTIISAPCNTIVCF